jgi:hypothetical protein
MGARRGNSVSLLNSGSRACPSLHRLTGWPATGSYFRLSAIRCTIRPNRSREVAIFISQPLPLVRAFVDEINAAIKAHNPLSPGLSAAQRLWLSFCLMAIMIPTLNLLGAI